MRLPPVIDQREFAPAELSALRLDGDCFRLGDGLVTVDQPVDPATRGAVLAAGARPGVVAEGMTAAWVYGAVPVLHRPLRFSVDRAEGRRTVPAGARLREVWFLPQDVQRIGGLAVTTPLRTAFDLARLQPDGTDLDGTGVDGTAVNGTAVNGAAVDEAIGLLLRAGGLDGPAAAALLHARGTMPHKRRGVDRLARLRA